MCIRDSYALEGVYASYPSMCPTHPSVIEPTASDGRSLARYFLLLFGLCLPVWVIGAIFDIELFPGFKLFQAGLAMPMIASLLLTYRERRWSRITALLRRTYDVVNIKPIIRLLPISPVYPSSGFTNEWTLQVACVYIPSPIFTLVVFMGN